MKVQALQSLTFESFSPEGTSIYNLKTASMDQSACATLFDNHIQQMDYCSWTLLALFFTLGCGDSQPSAPPPKTGYRDDKVSYTPTPDPLATEIKLADLMLVDNQPQIIPADQIPPVERHRTLAIEGAVQHPDRRMTMGAVLIRLLIPNPKSPDGFTTANEAVVMAKGENGRLEYRVEVRVPDTGPQQYTLKLVYSGVRKIPEAGEEPDVWTLPFAEGMLKVAASAKPR